MSRLAATLLLAVGGAACSEKAVHQLTFSATNLSRAELPDGTSRHSAMAVFLPAAIARAPRVYLYLEDVRLQPDTEVDVYLAPPDGSALDPKHLVQTLTAPSGDPVAFPVVAHELVDFERAGVRHTPRTALRGLAGVGFALHLKKGALEAERLVLSTGSPAEREALARRGTAAGR